MSEDTLELDNQTLTQAREAAKEKIRDVLTGDVFMHFTRLSRIPGILEDGVLSQSFAKDLGRKYTQEYPFKSKTDYIYYWKPSKDKEKNKEDLSVMFHTGILHAQNILVLIDKNEVVDQYADPALWYEFPGWSQGMTWQRVPKEGIVGVMILAGAQGDYSTPERQEGIKVVVGHIQKASEHNPRVAVPVYDQGGNVLWP